MVCRKQDTLFSDRFSIVFNPSSHARLAAQRWGKVGRGTHSPDPTAWGQVDTRRLDSGWQPLRIEQSTPRTAKPSILLSGPTASLDAQKALQNGQFQKYLCMIHVLGQILILIRVYLRKGFQKALEGSSSRWQRSSIPLRQFNLAAPWYNRQYRYMSG